MSYAAAPPAAGAIVQNRPTKVSQPYCTGPAEGLTRPSKCDERWLAIEEQISGDLHLYRPPSSGYQFGVPPTDENWALHFMRLSTVKDGLSSTLGRLATITQAGARHAD